MILANAKNMTNDIIISTSVFVGLGASVLFKLPFLDSVTAMLVGVWVMKSAIGIFMELNMELMDGNADDGLYKSLFLAVKSVPGAGNPHRARIRKMASAWDIDLDIEVDGSLTVRQAHGIAEHVEKAIREQIADVYDIMVHVEPAGGGEHTEQFGLSAKDITG
jgi:cation diffusion facilitator family transporter